jgi:exosortase/archaeosortase family protein
MQLDLKVRRRTILSVALVGILILPIINALRIAATILIGYSQGADVFWSIHKWIDYPIFLGFYFAATAYLMTQRNTPQVILSVGSDGNLH